MNNIYNNYEILDIANLIYDEYGYIFVMKNIPIIQIKNLAKLLEKSSIIEENKLKILEYSARIKYEIKMVIDLDFSISNNRFYMKFKKNDFAVNIAIMTMINSNWDYVQNSPSIIQSSIYNAFYKTKENTEILKK